MIVISFSCVVSADIHFRYRFLPLSYLILLILTIQKMPACVCFGQTYADICFILTMKSYSKICSLPMDIIILTWSSARE